MPVSIEKCISSADGMERALVDCYEIGAVLHLETRIGNGAVGYNSITL